MERLKRRGLRENSEERVVQRNCISLKLPMVYFLNLTLQRCDINDWKILISNNIFSLDAFVKKKQFKFKLIDELSPLKSDFGILSTKMH